MAGSDGYTRLSRAWASHGSSAPSTERQSPNVGFYEPTLDLLLEAHVHGRAGNPAIRYIQISKLPCTAVHLPLLPADEGARPEELACGHSGACAVACGTVAAAGE